MIQQQNWLKETIKVESSLNDINRMTNQMEIVKDKVDNIFKAIDKQTTVTASFLTKLRILP